MSWPTFWTKKRSWQSFLLKPLSSLVCFIADRRYTKFIKSKPVFVADRKIIRVGNIVVGGSG
ncbi:MAG TPA: tetraacyldisaccharide 4'-kinase, partial [Thiomicrospira sp.]|nr:tetraacyldisaccharide 4'-kinase [Thiomicrospira sp.]